MPGVRMTNGRAYADDAPPGTIQAMEDGTHFIRCPCGCGQVWHALHAVVSGSAEGGDLTLSPSLVMRSGDFGCGWHGWLQNGVFTSV